MITWQTAMQQLIRQDKTALTPALMRWAWDQSPSLTARLARRWPSSLATGSDVTSLLMWPGGVRPLTRTWLSCPVSWAPRWGEYFCPCSCLDFRASRWNKTSHLFPLLKYQVERHSLSESKTFHIEPLIWELPFTLLFPFLSSFLLP